MTTLILPKGDNLLSIQMGKLHRDTSIGYSKRHHLTVSQDVIVFVEEDGVKLLDGKLENSFYVLGEKGLGYGKIIVEKSPSFKTLRMRLTIPIKMSHKLIFCTITCKGV